ncbi:hypothetical protein [Vibrio crassostreae]|uniref:hypothetical protein n=1 Tax=Vibrio crassostreae TaxID=246167 RepID=UPI0010469E85|nr:hypothetical protein [Vibrio crassostreae]TCN91960.1 hypothetical protein EDB37_1001262 [Vibrio crassostreae]
MWKIFESDGVTIFILVIALVSSGMYMHEIFLKSIDIVSVLSIVANLATVLAATFGFWVYFKWKRTANNSEIHKLVLEFAVQLQSFDLTILRLLNPISKAQFVEDYESWTGVYRELMEFKAKYNFLTDQVNLSFMELNLPELAYLEGRLVRVRSLHIHACNDFDLSSSEGAGLLYDFLKGDVQREGKFNRFHLAWTSEVTYQTLSFSKAVGELQQLIHR